MSPITHGLAGWAVANAAALPPRDRLLVTFAGVAADVDGLGVIAEALTRHTSQPLLWWTNYHHVIGHNLFFGLLCCLAAAVWAQHRWRTAVLVLISYHLHLLGDVLGGRGPDGYVWTVPYLWPVSDAWTWAWEHQWKLNSWQNLVITAILLGWALYWAWRKGYTPLELIAPKADAAIVETLRRRFKGCRKN